jgi:phosphate-selective porin OprO/OprP
MHLTTAKVALSLLLVIATIQQISAQANVNEQTVDFDTKKHADSLQALPASAGLAQKQPVTWDSYWSQGFHLKSSDGDFKLKFGGRIQLDFLNIYPDSYYDTIVSFTQGVEFRRLRFYNSGTIYKNVSYKLQLDFAVGTAILKDAYINLSKLPLIGNVRMGHFKEPVGLELIASSNSIPFMERGLTNPLTPERNTGIMLHNTVMDERMKWALGYFLPSNSSGFGLYSGSKYHLTGRLSGVPIYNTSDDYEVLHLGISLTRQNQNNSKYVLTSRPETHLAPKLLLAEIDVADVVNQIGLESAFVSGSWSIQGEYISTKAHTAAESQLQKTSYNFSAYYAIISWFITGEHRNYKTSKGAFGQVDPKKNFGDGGPGAFEVALRYSAIDLEDTDVAGGEMSDVTVGLNWYLNPSTRFMFNYLLIDVKDQGRLNSFQTRFQIFF